MLKNRIGLLVTLVLALVATGLFSTLCIARELPGRDGSATVSGASAKPRPVSYSGEPDVPQAPPPPLRTTGNMPVLVPAGDGSDGDYGSLIRWISLVWTSWYTRAAY